MSTMIRLNRLVPSTPHQLIIFLCTLLVALPQLVHSRNCTCSVVQGDEAGKDNKHEALKYKTAAIAGILVAGGIGVVVPILGKRAAFLKSVDKAFLLVKAFAGGVILATGFIHVLPHAFESLTSPCLADDPWDKFPFTGLVAMIMTVITLMIESGANSYFANKGRIITTTASENEKVVEAVDVMSGAVGHSHGSGFPVALDGSDHPQRVVAQVLEVGMIVHSMIIGFALGASRSVRTIKPLVVTLCFHQFFEGMGLGTCISEANFKSKVVGMMALFFSLTTPTGIAIGIGVTNVYKENSPKALIVEGVLDAASAGVLIYMALVDLLAVDFLAPKLQSNGSLRFGATVFLVLGATSMTILAIWA